LQAIHAKLDELLRSEPEAQTNLAKLDDEEPEDIEKFRRPSLLWLRPKAARVV
jgi:low affinity Fe/Cu permease